MLGNFSWGCRDANSQGVKLIIQVGIYHIQPKRKDWQTKAPISSLHPCTGSALIRIREWPSHKSGLPVHNHKRRLT